MESRVLILMLISSFSTPHQPPLLYPPPKGGKESGLLRLNRGCLSSSSLPLFFPFFTALSLLFFGKAKLSGNEMKVISYSLALHFSWREESQNEKISLLPSFSFPRNNSLTSLSISPSFSEEL